MCDVPPLCFDEDKVEKRCLGLTNKSTGQLYPECAACKWNKKEEERNHGKEKEP